MSAANVTGLHQVAQRATDLEASTAFYRDVLGGRFIARFDPPGIAFVELAGTRLLLEGAAPSATLYYRVTDLLGTYDRLSKDGITFEGKPHLLALAERRRPG